MARSIATIAQVMFDKIAADPVLSKTFSSTSSKSIYRTWVYIVAFSQALFEQLADVFMAKAAATVSGSIIGTAPGLRKSSLEFQYSPTIPQNLQVVDYKFSYPKVDPALRIINICSLQVTSNLVIFNVASIDANQNITNLTAIQLNAFQAYINYIAPTAGNIYRVRSLAPDKVYFEANIIYKNNYNAATVLANIIAAVILYLNTAIANNIPNNPIVDLSDFLAAVKKADGVANFADGGIVNLFFRPDSTPLRVGTGFNPDQSLVRLIYGTDIMIIDTQLIAGYCVPETTVGYKFENKITLTPN